jgi:hypothetical protein
MIDLGAGGVIRVRVDKPNHLVSIDDQEPWALAVPVSPVGS